MKALVSGVLMSGLFILAPTQVFAANQGKIVNNPNAYRNQVLPQKHSTLTPPPPMHPMPPSGHHPYPPQPMPPSGHHPYPPPYPSHPPMQNGISIQYRAPTTVYQSSNSYSWVNGDPNVASIESSNYVLITDWRKLGLPAPPTGMYWIMENGRYILVPIR